jgi:hypothetical protein
VQAVSGGSIDLLTALDLLGKAEARVVELEAERVAEMSQRDDGSDSPEESGATKPSAVPSVGTGVPHLDCACELLWQHGHPAIAEALEREVAAAVRQEKP